MCAVARCRRRRRIGGGAAALTALTARWCGEGRRLSLVNVATLLHRAQKTRAAYGQDELAHLAAQATACPDELTAMNVGNALYGVVPPHKCVWADDTA
eukprot:gene37323-4518_t